MLRDIKKRFGKNKVIIDIGANVGNHTVFFSKICGAKKVYSFEPQKNIFKILSTNVDLNNLKDTVEIYNMGLGRSNFYAGIEVLDETNYGRSKIKKDSSGEIAVNSLDNVLLGNVREVDVLKIDVEGMEIDVLEGAKNILKKYKPAIYVEAGTIEEYNVLKNYLEDYNYTLVCRFNATPTYLFV